MGNLILPQVIFGDRQNEPEIIAQTQPCGLLEPTGGIMSPRIFAARSSRPQSRVMQQRGHLAASVQQPIDTLIA